MGNCRNVNLSAAPLVRQGIRRAFQKKIGDDRDRTGNLRRARAALSQLSYVPQIETGHPPKKMEQVKREPLVNYFRHWRFAPLADSPFTCSKWAHVDSNHGPQLYQSCALAN